MRFKIFCCRCENANSASLSQWRKHFFLQIQMLIFRPERPDRSAEKVSDIAERLFLIVCLKMHKVLCCQQWQRGLKACAVDSEVIACYDIQTQLSYYVDMLLAGNQYACTCICALRRKAGLGMRHHLKRYNYAAPWRILQLLPQRRGHSF